MKQINFFKRQSNIIKFISVNNNYRKRVWLAFIFFLLMPLATLLLNNVIYANNPEWTKSTVNGNFYTLTPSITWTDAEAWAQEWRGHLVTIRNRLEELWIRDVLGTNEKFWIGYNVIGRTHHVDNFYWSSGESSSYTNWKDIQPDNNDGTETVTAMNDEPNLPTNPIGADGWNDLNPGHRIRGVAEIVIDDELGLVLESYGEVSITGVDADKKSNNTNKKGDLLRTADLIKTYTNSMMMAAFPAEQGSRIIDIQPESEIKIAEGSSPSNITIDFFKGEIKSKIKDLPEYYFYEVITPQSVIAPRGTEFIVEGNESYTKITVLEGSVEVTTLDGTQSVMVQEGYAVQATDDGLGEPYPVESNPAWIVYDVDNTDLPSNYVTSIAIDESGAKWIGSRGGLVSFDGTNWTVYDTINSVLPDNRIWSLALEKNGTMWIGTWDGLASFDGTNWAVYDTTNSDLPDNAIRSIAIDESGIKWIGTEGGLVRFDGENWTVYNSDNSDLSADYINAIVIDGDGTKWMGASWWCGLSGAGLISFDNTSWTIYKTSNSGLPHDFIVSLAIDSSGTKWIGTLEGHVASFDGMFWTTYTTSDFDMYYEHHVVSIAIDESGTNWIGTDGGGMLSFQQTNWTVYDTHNSGLPNNRVGAIAIDDYGNKWIGTSGGGLAVYNDGGIVSVDEQENVNHYVPDRIVLYQNYPNPFNPSTTIRYSVPERVNVNLTVYNMLGQKVARLAEGEVEGGIHEVTFDASYLPSGLYMYRLQAGEYVEGKRLLLLK